MNVNYIEQPTQLSLILLSSELLVRLSDLQFPTLKAGRSTVVLI